MKTVSIFPIALAVGFAAGCTAPQVHISPARPAIWHDTGTPPATVALRREVRHHRDQSGTLRDDRGRKVDTVPNEP